MTNYLFLSQVDIGILTSVITFQNVMGFVLAPPG